MFRLTIALVVFTVFSSFSNESFLDSIKENFKPIPLKVLKEKVKAHSLIKGSYLSLGESHSEKATVHALYKGILEQYLSNGTNTELCIEAQNQENSLLEKEYIENLNFSKVKLMLDNGPALTNFNECRKRRKRNRVVYSGYYHQYRFANNYVEFGKSPVIVDKSNNILSQLGSKNSMFITQLELDRLVKAAIILPIVTGKSYQEIKKSYRVIKRTLDQIGRHFERQSFSNVDSFFEKDIIVLDQNSFSKNLNGQNNYIILTNYAYRNVLKLFNSIENVIFKLEQSRIDNFLSRVSTTQKKKMMIFSEMYTKEKILMNYGYGVFDGQFEANSFALQLVYDKTPVRKNKDFFIEIRQNRLVCHDNLLVKENHQVKSDEYNRLLAEYEKGKINNNLILSSYLFINLDS